MDEITGNLIVHEVMETSEGLTMDFLTPGLLLCSLGWYRTYYFLKPFKRKLYNNIFSYHLWSYCSNSTLENNEIHKNKNEEERG